MHSAATQANATKLFMNPPFTQETLPCAAVQNYCGAHCERGVDIYSRVFEDDKCKSVAHLPQNSIG